MVKIRTLVPLTHPTTGESFAVGVEVDVAKEVAADWRADGKVSLLDDEKAAEERASEGAYTARTGRAEAAHEEKTESAPRRRT